jgi:hypothetical protein
MVVFNDPESSEEDQEEEDANDIDWASPLRPGFSKWLLVALLFKFQNRFKINNTAMRAVFRTIKLVLVAADVSTKFPSFDKSKTKFSQPFQCKEITRDVCPYCEWMYGEVDVAEVCPVCEADRYRTYNSAQVPRKQFTYRRFYKNGTD